MNSILIVDDEASFRENLAEYLGAHGFRALQAGDAESALVKIREEEVGIVIADVRMPGMDGITLLTRLREVSPQTEVVIVTGQASVESAVEAMRLGAFHYLTKPLRLAELELVVRRAAERGTLKKQNATWREERRRKHQRSSANMVAASAAMLKLLEEARRVAATDMNVLIEGETGTGKELLAEYIHANSARSDCSFSVLNCGGFSETLLDAELFGHEKGAFTGATEARPGMLELADGGTLLLDEIGDIPPAAQIRFLRFLDRGLIRRVGSTREISLNVRILAATHRNLDKEVSANRLREDLYHRLIVVRLRVPPLRERPDDILPLVEHCLARAAMPDGQRPSLSDAARAALQAHVWPGNVRELVHTMERARFAAHMAGAERIGPEHLGLPAAAVAATAQPKAVLNLKEAEHQHVLQVLNQCGGNRSRAAEALGVSERHLYRLLQGKSAEGAQEGDKDVSPA